MPGRPDIDLPSRYYLDHFTEMLDFVESRYGHAFEDRHRETIARFRELGLDARCLYVRIANRKGHLFPRHHLRYEEINSLEDAAAELREQRFLRDIVPADFPGLLALLTRPDLVTLIRERAPDPDTLPSLSSAKKKRLVEFAEEALEFESCFPETERTRYLAQDRIEEIEYLLYLYFGRLRHGLTSFALRDLGIMKLRGDNRDFAARFESRDVALSSFFYARTLAELEHGRPDRVDELAGSIESWPSPGDPEVDSLRHRAVHRLGRFLERAGEREAALGIYRHSDEFPSTERTARLLHDLGRREEAETLVERLIDSPSCDEELLFAEDFHRRKYKGEKVGRLTSLLRSARVIGLDESARDAPEAAAANFLSREGGADCEAHHVENAIWAQLFGLLFWEQLYGEEATGLHSDFDAKPRGLDTGEFYRKHEPRIEELLAGLDVPEAAIARLGETFDRNADSPNALVPWSPGLFALTRRLLSLAPAGALAPPLREMARNHRGARSGFPDLVVFRGDEVSFVEVKAEGDRIQRNQLARIEALIRAGFPVEVVRAKWTVDPGQEYVVVDVETTGGKAEWHRVTEIGAVRIRGGEIVDEWTSLLDPGRRIPRQIVQLTGITDEMVAGAPRFPEIADEFRDFCGDAVFAAHRASFDFGFIREEYRRLDQEFHLPTLCTVVAARRAFPGLPSYGLARLCEHFGIPLESHHRALCDARATAEILLRINRRRLELARGEEAKGAESHRGE